MRLSVTSHFHLLKYKLKAARMMAAAGFQYVRVSSMQREVLSLRNAADLNMITDAGMGVVAILNADRFATLSFGEWTSYCTRFVKYLPAVAAVQIGNEWNTSIFYGGSPDPTFALSYYLLAARIILDRFPGMYLIAPGLSNESKSDGKTKVSARDFLEVWTNRMPFPLSAWALHYYHEKPKRDYAIFAGNRDYLREHGRELPIILTETGCERDPDEWYGVFRETGIPHVEDVCWYAFNGHKGFNLVDDALKPSNLYQRMVEDAGRKDK